MGPTPLHTDLQWEEAIAKLEQLLKEIEEGKEICK